MSNKIAVIYGSVRKGRKGIGAAKYIVKKLNERAAEGVLIDPIEYKLPLLEKMYKSYGEGEAPKVLQDLHEIFTESDGFILVSAEYNHSIPPALSNLIDHFQAEFFFKPSGIVTYSAGSFGGVRATHQLRSITGELGMPSIPAMLPIPKVQDVFKEDGSLNDDAYERRTHRFLNEFDWYVEALKTQRQKGTQY